jgi:NitT/TauT family transport system permease protein
MLRGRWVLVGSLGYPLLSLLITLIIWIAAVRIFAIRAYLLPPPDRILVELVRNHDVLMRHAFVTLYETLLGFGLAITVGIALAMLIVYSQFFGKTLYPLLVSAQTIPKTAIAPLFLVWLGFGTLPKIVIAFLIAVFPMIINTVVGMSSTDPDMIRLAHSMGASESKIFRKIRLPYALPTIMAGVKVATTLSIIGAIVGEFVGANAGIGYLLMRTLRTFNTSLTFAALFCCIAMGLLLFGMVQVAESLLIPWHVSRRRGS